MALADLLLPKLFSLAVSLARQALTTFASRLLLFLIAALAISLPLAWTVWTVAIPDAESAGAMGALGWLLAACYLASGVLWAVHRSCLAAINSVAPLLEERSSTLLNELAAGLPAQYLGRERRVEIAALRSCLDELFGNGASDGAADMGRLPFGRFARWIARRSIRNELSAASNALDAVERSGETTVSAVDLGRHVHQRVVSAAVETARSRVRIFGWACAATALVLMVGPVELANFLLA